MSEISIIRRANIKATLKRGDLGRIAKYLGKNTNYLSQVFSKNSVLNVSTALARGVEEAVGLDRGALDLPVTASEIESNKPTSKFADQLFSMIMAELFAPLTIEANSECSFGVHARWKIINNSNPYAVAELSSSDVGDILFARKSLLAAMLASGAIYGVLGIEDNDGLNYEYYCNNHGCATQIDKSVLLNDIA